MIYTIRHGDTHDDVPAMSPSRQPAHISWCEDCGCFLNNQGVHFVMVERDDGELVQVCPRCAEE
jgi:hypothetical protein